MPIRALILDFDGLILDTESPSLQCWQEFYASYGHTFPIDQWLVSLGCAVRKFDPYSHLVSLAGPSLTIDTLRARRREREVQLVHALPLCPGIQEILAAACALSFKLAVASSSSRGWVEGHLVRHNIRHYFDALICKEDTPLHKPDPAPYLAALAALNVAPADAIALEDSPNGITAAQAAGLFAVAIPNAVTRQLDLSHANLIVENLVAYPLSTLFAHAQRSNAPRVPLNQSLL